MVYENATKLEHNRPGLDIILAVTEQNRNCLIIDVACPNDRRVVIKQEKKINKYLEINTAIVLSQNSLFLRPAKGPRPPVGRNNRASWDRTIDMKEL